MRCSGAARSAWSPPLHRGAVSSATTFIPLGTLSTKSPELCAPVNPLCGPGQQPERDEALTSGLLRLPERALAGQRAVPPCCQDLGLRSVLRGTSAFNCLRRCADRLLCGVRSPVEQFGEFTAQTKQGHNGSFFTRNAWSRSCLPSGGGLSALPDGASQLRTKQHLEILLHGAIDRKERGPLLQQSSIGRGINVEVMAGPWPQGRPPARAAVLPVLQDFGRPAWTNRCSRPGTHRPAPQSARFQALVG